jgi:hypothetical protein
MVVLVAALPVLPVAHGRGGWRAGRQEGRTGEIGSRLPALPPSCPPRYFTGSTEMYGAAFIISLIRAS